MLNCFDDAYIRLIIEINMKPAVVVDGIMKSDFDTLAKGCIEVYEVLRLVNGVPLFWEAHFERFINSVGHYFDRALIVESDFLDDLQLLALHSNLSNCNIRFAVLIDAVSHQPKQRILHTLEAIYPSSEMYENGVDIGIYRAERPDPSIKVLLPELRKKTTALLAENGWYEVLLIDDNDHITEGSKSNLFFVKKGEVITSLDHKVLPGITRQRVIALIKTLNLNFTQRSIAFSELQEMDAIFITGTSPKLLPVKRCCDILYNVDDSTMRALMKAFDADIEVYLKSAR